MRFSDSNTTNKYKYYIYILTPLSKKIITGTITHPFMLQSSFLIVQIKVKEFILIINNNYMYYLLLNAKVFHYNFSHLCYNSINFILSTHNKYIFCQSWIYGHSTLTSIGKRQQFLLGQYIRMRYSQLISDNFAHHEVLISATNNNHIIQ